MFLHIPKTFDLLQPVKKEEPKPKKIRVELPIREEELDYITPNPDRILNAKAMLVLTPRWFAFFVTYIAISLQVLANSQLLLHITFKVQFQSYKSKIHSNKSREKWNKVNSPKGCSCD